MEAASVPAESGGQSGEAPGGEAPQFDLSPVLDRVGQVGQSVDQFAERLQALEGRLPEQGGDPEYGDPYGQDDPYADLDDPSLYEGEDGEMDPRAAQQYLEQLVDRRASALAEQQVQQHVEPLMNQLDELMQDRAAEEILGEFPELADEQRAEQFMDTAANVVSDLGLPEELAGRMITSAPFLRLVAQAARHQEAARNEQPVTETREHPLEPAGGANLGGGEPNLAQEIVNSRGGNAFWGT